MKKDVKVELWRLRIEVVKAYDAIKMSGSINANSDKISGYTDNGILMNPKAMQQFSDLLVSARESNDAMSNFGRSNLKAKEDSQDQEAQAEGILSQFGRSIRTSEDLPTAADKVVEKEEKEEKIAEDSPHSQFKTAMRDLEKFLKENGLRHFFRCKSEKLDDEEYEKMLIEVEDIDFEDNDERVISLKQARSLKDKSVFDYCRQKPYQCMVCPYYYKDMAEFFEMKEMRKKEDVNEEQ